jgi:hypothetical protein
MTRLTTFNLFGNKIGGEGANALADVLPQMASLTLLNLDGTALASALAAALAAALSAALSAALAVPPDDAEPSQCGGGDSVTIRSLISGKNCWRGIGAGWTAMHCL